MTSGLGGRMQLLNPAYAIVLARSTDIRLEGNTIEHPVLSPRAASLFTATSPPPRRPPMPGKNASLRKYGVARSVGHSRLSRDITGASAPRRA